MARLKWTGHALIDVGLAGLCAFGGRERPEALTLEDLDSAADFMSEHYYEGKLGTFLSAVDDGACPGADAVSLDIDFDVLFTDPAPVEALVQRFGRVNRGRVAAACGTSLCTALRRRRGT